LHVRRDGGDYPYSAYNEFWTGLDRFWVLFSLRESMNLTGAFLGNKRKLGCKSLWTFQILGRDNAQIRIEEKIESFWRSIDTLELIFEELDIRSRLKKATDSLRTI
jgi:hypothetical protein